MIDPTTLLQIIFWVVLLVLLVVGFGSFLVVRSWQDQTRVELKDLLSRLRFFKNESKTIHLVVQDYAGHERPPYGPLVSALIQQMEALDRKIQALQTAYARVQESVHARPVQRMDATLRAPLRWYHLRQQMLELQAQHDEIERDLGEAMSGLEQLHRQSWEVALQARQFQAGLQEAARSLHQLQGWGLEGDEFDAAVERQISLQTALETIPVAFLTAPEEEVLAQPDRPVVISLHQLLNERQPELDGLIVQAKTWIGQYQEAAANLAALQSASTAARQQLTAMPQDLLLSELDARLKKIAGTAKDLNARLSRPAVSQLGTLATEARQATRVVQDLSQQLEKSRQQQADLVKTMGDLAVGLEMLMRQMADLGTRSIYPVVWEESKALLTELQKKSTDLGPIQMPRTPAEVDKTLAAAADLLTRWKGLNDHYHQVATKYEEFQPLLAALDARQSLDWCQGAQALAAQIQSYHPDNWPRQDSVFKFGSEVQVLADQLPGLLPVKQALPVKETELGDRLDKLRQLAGIYQGLRAREASIRQRLDEILTLEKDAEEALGSSRTVLNQVGLLAHANPILQEAAEKEINQLIAEGEQISAELENKRQGSVDKKAQKIQGFRMKVEQSCNTWLGRLNNDLRSRKEAIAAQLSTLQAIAQLDERAINEAEKLLAAGGRTRTAHKSRVLLTDMILQFRQANEEWQNSLAISRALEDLEKPINDANQKLIEQRQKAGFHLAEASKLVPDRRDWPPTSQTLATEIQEFDELEKQLDAIQKDRNNALWLVSKLSDMARRYQSVAQRSRSIADRAEDDQNRIQQLEGDLDQSLQLWRTQLNAYTANDFARKGIQNVLDVANREYNSLKRQYTQGNKPYQHVEQGLVMLVRQVNSAQVSIDNTQRIDINGEVRAGRGRF